MQKVLFKCICLSVYLLFQGNGIMQNIQLIDHSDIQIIMSFIGLRKTTSGYCDNTGEIQRML